MLMSLFDRYITRATCLHDTQTGSPFCNVVPGLSLIYPQRCRLGQEIRYEFFEIVKHYILSQIRFNSKSENYILVKLDLDPR